MGNSADRAWQLSQLVEGVLTAFNPSHGSLSCVKTNCVSFASAQARKLNRSVCFSFPHKVATLWGPQLWPDIVCPNRSGRPRRVSRSPEACFWVVARAVRVSQPAVLSTLLAIQLFGSVIPPPNFLKEHQKERCGHSRSQRSFITFYGALRNILLSAGFPVTIHMIALEQTFVKSAFE